MVARRQSKFESSLSSEDDESPRLLKSTIALSSLILRVGFSSPSPSLLLDPSLRPPKILSSVDTSSIRVPAFARCACTFARFFAGSPKKVISSKMLGGASQIVSKIRVKCNGK